MENHPSQNRKWNSVSVVVSCVFAIKKFPTFYFFHLVKVGSGPRSRTKRVKNDCTLSADYYNID